MSTEIKSEAREMPEAVRQYLSEIGRKGGLIGGKIGGKAKTKRKGDASRHNGHKGGRPRKQEKVVSSP